MLRFRYMLTEEAKRRIRILAFWERHGIAATREAFGVSRRTLYRWQYLLRKDATVVGFIDGVKRYTLAGIDTERGPAFATAYTHGSASAADFLRRTRDALPDYPPAVQTDNGSEFVLHLEAACRERGITPFRTQPKSPKMNA